MFPVWRLVLGAAYMVFVRFFDFLSLVLSQMLTLFGLIRWTSADEIVNKRNPARFMSWSKRKQLLNQFNGGFLLDGKLARLSRKKSFQSIITTGGMGMGKSANLILPNILTAENCSLVITDTSGELFEQTSGYLESKGFYVRALNLIDPAFSCRYNPLAHVHSPSDAEGIAHILVRSAGGHSSEKVWEDGAKRLLRILIRAVKNAKGDAATLSDVLYWLNNFDAHSGGGALDDFIVQHTLNDAATFEDYKGFTNTAPEKMMLSFVSTAATALSLIGNEDIAKLCCFQDFDFKALKDKKTALYVMVRQQDMGTYAFLLSLFYTELCNALLAERRGHLPVYLMLDEFGHLSIPGFETFATTARKYRVGFWLIVQSLAQLEERYGRHGARTILGGIGTETYFGGMDVETAQNISTRLGTAFHLNILKPSGGLHPQPLMRPDQLIRLEDNELLVLHANKDPVRLKTVPFYHRGDLRKKAQMPPAALPMVVDLR